MLISLPSLNFKYFCVSHFFKPFFGFKQRVHTHICLLDVENTDSDIFTARIKLKQCLRFHGQRKDVVCNFVVVVVVQLSTALQRTSHKYNI